MIIRIGQNYNVSVWHKLLASLKLSISKVCIKELHTRNDLNSRCNNFRKKFDVQFMGQKMCCKSNSNLIYKSIQCCTPKNHLNATKNL